MKRRTLFLIIALLVATAIAAYLVFRPKPIKVGLANVPDFIYSRMAQSVDKKNVALNRVEKATDYSRFDVVISFAMGIKWSDEDRTLIRNLGKKGTKHFSWMPTNPDNDISNLDSTQQALLVEYLANGGNANYRNAFNYLRSEVLHKSLRGHTTLEKPISYPDDALFTKDSDDLAFASLQEYETYYKAHGMRPGAPRVAVFTSIVSPFSSDRGYLNELMAGLEAEGFNVYGVSASEKKLQLLQEIAPDLIVVFPHGRFSIGHSKELIEYLKKQNIPMLAPLTINDLRTNWEKDPKGMIGGFLSQSVVTPELDGAIVPIALTAMEEVEGLKIFKTIPRRLDQFCALAKHYVKLRTTPNHQKKIALFYYKGPGQNSLIAQGIEVVPSLYNLLKSLAQQGYDLTGLPPTLEAFSHDLATKGAIFNSYSEGNIASFLQSGAPAFVASDSLQRWINATFPPAIVDSIAHRYGPVPGEYYRYQQEGQEGLAVIRLQYGNVALLPQLGTGAGANDFKMVHGAIAIPSYPYLASYLWVRNAFHADALIHFGTHGSLEFIPGKQIALATTDFADRLVNDLPHIYYYTTANIGEGTIAKRRSYAQLVSYLAPPFMGTQLQGELAQFSKLLETYLAKEQDDQALSLKIKQATVAQGFHRDLKLDSNLSVPYTREDIKLIDDFVGELAYAKIPGGLYTTGIPFSKERIANSAKLLSIDPIAYGLCYLDLANNKITQAQYRDEAYYRRHYIPKATATVARLQHLQHVDVTAELSRLGLTARELHILAQSEHKERGSLEESMRMKSLKTVMAQRQQGKPDGISAATKRAANGHPASKPSAGAMGAATAKHPANSHPDTLHSPDTKGIANDSTKPSPQLVEALHTLKQAVTNVHRYADLLTQSPTIELNRVANALQGGYTPPSPGGDYIADPQVLPTGRNLYSINPENTPSAKAWEDGKKLANELIADYQKRHNGQFPHKVSFSLWSSSFIESQGTTIAEILYLLGVEPVRDRMNRVLDVRLMPNEALRRPRIDVVALTSGQLRDIATSRLFLIQKAVQLAAAAPKSQWDNNVAQGVADAEKALLEKGLPAAAARQLSQARVFGALNGGYGTGIQEMVESGDRWSDRSEIAEVFLHNVGAFYGQEESYGEFTQGAFAVALLNTDAVVQPRQSNSWGALSLDHVYEFMGGLTLAVQHVTGKDPEGYMNDLRNRHRVRNQEIKQAVGIEARTTLLNPAYIKEYLKEGASAADDLAELIRNTYAWNVMKPSLIDQQLWNAIYDTYVLDSKKLGVREFFDRVNPAALQDYTAYMMETARKGLWKASPEQLKNLAQLHAQTMEKHGAGCSEMVCDNHLLRQYIAEQLPKAQQPTYAAQLNKALKMASPDQPTQQNKAQVLKQEKAPAPSASTSNTHGLTYLWLALALAAIVAVVALVRRRRK